MKREEVSPEKDSVRRFFLYDAKEALISFKSPMEI